MVLLFRHGTTITSVLILLFGLACYSIYAGVQSFLGLHSLSSSLTHPSNQHPWRRTDTPKACRGKEAVLSLLEEPTAACHVTITTTASSSSSTLPSRGRHVLGMTTCHVHDMCQQIPPWKQLTKAYGTKHPIVVFAAEHVRAPQQTNTTATLHTVHVQDNTTPLRIVGLPGTTSAVAAVLRRHEGGGDRPPNDRRRIITEHMWSPNDDDKDTAATAAITVCVIRDPFRWMADMCHNPPSSLHWIIPQQQRQQQHCPNLVPSPNDPLLARTRLQTYTVQYTTTTNMVRYASLADLWAAYAHHTMLQQSSSSSSCTVTVRWEDAVLLAPDAVRAAVGWTTDTTTTRTSTKSRVTDWSAWTRGRYAGMERGDVAYARRVLPPHVLRTWGYLPVPVVE